MNEDKIRDYIDTNLKNGISIEKIEENLKNEYTEEDFRSIINEYKNKKKSINDQNYTTYMLIIIIATSLIIFFGIMNFFNSIMNIGENLKLHISTLTIQTIGILIYGYFVYLLITMNKETLKWVHIAFGYSIFSVFATITLNFIFPSLSGILGGFITFILYTILIMPLTIAIWVTFASHLKKVF